MKLTTTNRNETQSIQPLSFRDGNRNIEMERSILNVTAGFSPTNFQLMQSLQQPHEIAPFGQAGG